MSFSSLSVENGLSQNSALAIAQDKQGFIWIGTRTGLNKYDTRNFTIYKNIPDNKKSISDNYIMSLLGDSKGNLWIGTINGLNRYDAMHDNFEQIKHSDTGVSRLTHNTINCIYEDSKHRLWIGTDNGLNLLTDAAQLRFSSFFYAGSPQSSIGLNIHSVFEDSEGVLWLGTTTGLYKVNVQNGTYHHEAFRHDANNPNTISSDIINTILEDQAHNFWIGTLHDGLNLMDRKTGTFTHFLHDNKNENSLTNDNVRKLTLDNQGNMWVGTQDGLGIMQRGGKSFVSHRHDPEDKSSLSQNSIYSIFKDNVGSMWVGTFFGGANTVYSNAFTLYQNTRAATSISNNVISSIVEDELHDLWVGTEGGGLNHFDRKANIFTNYKTVPNDSTSLTSNLVKVVYIDKTKNIWIGTNGGGLCRFDKATGRFKRHVNVQQKNKDAVSGTEVITLLEDSHQRLWIGTLSGLTYLENKNGSYDLRTSPASFPIVNSGIHYLFEDTQKRLWIGTASGFFILKENATQPTYYAGLNTADKTSQPAFINCIQQDSKGRIWMGTELGGLALFDEATQKLEYFTEKNQLASNNVFGILEGADGDLWISTSNGLSRFNTEKKTFKTYTSGDGLAGNQFNNNSFLKDSRGEFFFGGYNGISAFFPERIESNNYVAPMTITGLRLFNKPIAIGGEDGLLNQNINFTKDITFSYDQNVFTLDFALLNFIKNGKNKYLYKLDKFDKDWNETSASFATYTNLPPGSYTFLVKGANNDGVWSEPTSLHIQVLPPFWRTWWAYFIYILFIAAIVFMVTRFFFLRALVKKEEVLHQSKLGFFTNVSHEIRTHLTLIMAPVDKLLETQQKDSFAKQQLTHVKNNANRLLKLVSELMDFRKAETNNLQLHVAKHNLVAFLEDIYTSFQELSLVKNIKTSFIYPSENIPLYFDQEQLEKVFFNLLTNAFKFTPEGGNILMNLELKNNNVIITVTDNGRGIAPEFQDKLFNNFFQVADHGKQNTGYGIGLALAKNIVELHKGTITVESEPATAEKPGRTCFTVTLLQGNQHLSEALLAPASTNPVTEISSEKNYVTNKIDTNLADSSTEKPYTILICEDTAELRQLIQETFQQQYQVIVTENGLQGWEQAIEQIPDLIISDVMMPEMDGFTLCSKLKTDERTSHIPVILLTAKSSQSDQVSGLETGADMYLTKPFSTKVLELNVRNLLAGRERMRKRYSRQVIPTIEADENIEPSVETITEPASYANPIDQEFLDKMLALVEEYMDDPEFGVAMLTRKVAMSAPILYKKLKAVTGMSVNDFVKSLRLKKAAELLAQKKFTVYEVAYAVGYNDRKYFSKEFKKVYGKTPSEYIGEEEV